MFSIDRLIVEFDRALRTVFASSSSARPVPGGDLPEEALSDEERRHAVGLMRINHCGEICAQALYQGQSLTSRDPLVREALMSAAHEEVEHLAWTEMRIAELGGRTTLLAPFWYAGALSMGVFAGVLGDRWNLGFLAETERQVEAHLGGHLMLLPAGDVRSKAVVEQMRLDEMQHAEMAVRFGAAKLPGGVRLAMKLAAKVMTTTAYRL
ncbi:MAG: 2-polyprenyl-3-methyl-6-methoxy-1,4-benzoquinone monooxygenase [Rhodocyclales bacterium GT-UBC]|nr:MAG: 2-polyprenyl-3-methyl-6-methoxy-1,4-benzoquinone monooxygenase [Rhodocyclales bacterium GT-UBC]